MRIEDRRPACDLNQDNHRRGGRHRRRRMQDDAQWAVIRVRVDGVHVGNLNDCQEGEQNQTHQRDHRQGSEPSAVLCAELCLKLPQPIYLRLGMVPSRRIHGIKY